ncbi:MAG: NEW3 domain-containing protein [Planctomycetota bacterium]
MKRFFAALLLAASVAAARDFADGFERDGDKNDLPDGWTTVTPGAGPAGTLALGAGKDGRGLVLTAPASGSMAAETRLAGQLDLANDYVLSGWIKVEGADGASGFITVQLVDERGDPLGPPQSTPQATSRDDWTLLSLPVSLLDSRTRSVAVRACLSNRSGEPATARFDDVSWVAKAFVDGFELDLDKDGFPDRWRSIPGDEFPAFNATQTRVATEEFHGGGRAAALWTKGRSAGLETRGAVAVDPDRAYELTVWVKTGGLRESSAWAEIEWLDEGERRIGVARTAGIRDTAGAWKALHLEAAEIPAKARKARLRLVLGGDDVEGRAWFDDVEWLGRVRVRLDTEGRPGSIYREGEARDAGGVSGNVVALGLEPGAYEVHAVVRDADGKTTWEGRVGGVELPVRENLALPFKFPATVPGPYEVRLDIRSSDKPLVQARAAFAIAHEPHFAKGKAGEYGASVDPYAHPGRRSGAVLSQAGIGRLRVVLWGASARDRADLAPEGAAMHEILLDLRRNGLDLVGVLAGPGGSAAPRTLAEWFGARDRGWEEPLSKLVGAHRDVVALWQTGDSDLSLARASDSATLEELAAAIRGTHELASPGLAWPADVAPPSAGSAAFLSLDLDRASAGLAAALAADPREKLFVFAPLSASDLAARAVEARSRGLLALVASGGVPLLDDDGTPAPSWFALRVLNDLLSSASPVQGELLPGLPAFRKDGRLILALRSEPPRAIESWLGEDVVRVDLLGRSRKLTPDPGGRLRIEASSELAFLVVRDAAFADTQISGGFEGLPLKSRANPQRAVFRLTNRFAEPLKNLRIVSVDLPARWRPVEPVIEHTSVDPGASAAFPLDLAVPSDIRPGGYEIRLRITFSVGGVRREAVLTRALPVLPEIEVTPRVEPTADGKGLEVTVTVHNRGEKKADFKVYLNRGPGTRTLDDVVYALEPGQERIVRFLVEPDEKGKEYLVGLRGIEDDLFVNEAVKVP